MRSRLEQRPGLEVAPVASPWSRQEYSQKQLPCINRFSTQANVLYWLFILPSVCDQLSPSKLRSLCLHLTQRCTILSLTEPSRQPFYSSYAKPDRFFSFFLLKNKCSPLIFKSKHFCQLETNTSLSVSCAHHLFYKCNNLKPDRPTWYISNEMRPQCCKHKKYYPIMIL